MYKNILTLILLFASPVWADIEQSREVLQTLASKVRFQTLSNGLRVVLYKRGEAPVFSGVVAVRVGGVDEVPGRTGISHMLEHMAFKGTPEIGTTDFSREKKLLSRLEELMLKSDSGLDLDLLSEKEKAEIGEIRQELEGLWKTADLTSEFSRRGGADLNASTGKDITEYHVSLPANAFEFWCWIESERLLHPVMRQFYQERDVVMEERRMRYEDDPQGKLYETMLGTVYLQHPYRQPVIGYPTDLMRLTASATEQFRAAYYVPENAVISVVGNLDLDQASATIERYFGRLHKGVRPRDPQIEEPVQEGERSVTIEMDASPQLLVAYRKVQYPHPDDAPISIMLEVLAGSSVSPLYEELVKRRQIAASVGTFEAPGSAYPNLMVFSIVPKSPHSNLTALEAMDEVLNKFKRRAVTAEELQIAKRAVALEYLTHMTSNLEMASDFASSELLYKNWKALIDWYDKVMAVTAEDVERVADQYLIDRQRTIARLESYKSVPDKGVE